MSKITTLAMVITAFFAIFSFIEFLISVLSALRKKDYEWFTLKWIIKPEAWWQPVLIAAILITGTCAWLDTYVNGKIDASEAQHQETEFIEMGYCDYCDSKIPEEYLCDGDDGRYCANCLYSSISEMNSGEISRCWKCSTYYFTEDSFGYGLCYDCSNHTVLECDMCMDMTFRWSADEVYALCPNCLGELLARTELKDILRDMYE